MEEIKLIKEFITLGQLLQAIGLADSGAQAKHLVKNLDIKVNSETENRRGRKLYQGDFVLVDERQILIK